MSIVRANNQAVLVQDPRLGAAELTATSEAGPDDSSSSASLWRGLIAGSAIRWNCGPIRRSACPD